MTDDDLTRDLEAWAAATDPDTDPIAPAEITDAPAIDIRPPHRGARRPILAVAAALLVVLGLGAALVVTTADDDPAEVVTATTTTVTDDGPRTQIVIDGPLLDTSWWMVVHRFALFGPDGAGATGPVEAGRSLIVDQHLAPGRWELRILRYACAAPDDESRECGAPNPDGTPAVDVTPTTCDVDLDVAAEGGRIAVLVDQLDDGTPTCGLSRSPFEPELTVPPAWSVRPPLPWSCGSASYDINGQIPGSDSEGALATLDCFREALADGTPVEIPAAELQAGDGLTRSWWRVLPEPVDGHPIEVIRDQGLEGNPGWARLYCDDVTVEPTRQGGPVDQVHVGARPSGCTDEEPLPLDLPSLDGPAPTPGTTTPEPATTTTGPDGGTNVIGVDVILDLQPGPAPAGDEILEWWSLSHDDGRTFETLAGEPIEPGGTRSRALVARDVRIEAGDRWSLTWGRNVCGTPGMCPPRGLRGAPQDGRAGTTVCTADLSTEYAEGTIVVTLTDDTCTSGPVESIPELTVPPAWSLREPLVRPCGIPGTLGADDDHDAIAGRTVGFRRCFVDAVRAGDELEMRSPFLIDEDAPNGRTWRHHQGTVSVFGHGDPVTGEGWTVQTCSSMVEISEEPFMEGMGCGPVEPLSMTP